MLADDRKLLFGLYVDGTVIYASPSSAWKENRHGVRVPTYFRAKLSPEEKGSLLARLNPGELHSLRESSFDGCKMRSTRNADGLVWITSCPTDGPKYLLVYRDGPRTATVEIDYGLDPGPFSNRESIPPSLVRIWDVLRKFSAGGEAWTPEEFLLTFLNVDESEIPRKRRATIGCPWPSERAGEFPSEAELHIGKVCHVLPAHLRDPTHEWIMRCWGLARPSKSRYVSVRAWDLLPGEPPSSLPFKFRCED